MVRDEFSATEVRRVLQELFPLRRLVLSQFTFFNQTGVACPTGDTYRRKRRCYRIVDILPIAVVLALKEQGIPLKNISRVPQLIQRQSAEIFRTGRGCRLYGHGETIALQMPAATGVNSALASLLGLSFPDSDRCPNGSDSASEIKQPEPSEELSEVLKQQVLKQEVSTQSVSSPIFWGFDVGELAEQICAAASRIDFAALERSSLERGSAVGGQRAA